MKFSKTDTSEFNFRAYLKGKALQEVSSQFSPNYEKTIISLLLKHRPDRHKSNFKETECFWCEEKLPSIFDYKIHMRDEHNIEKFYQIKSWEPWCERCGELFNNKQGTGNLYHLQISLKYNLIRN